MSERTEPLTPTVLFVGDKRSNWQNPPIYRLTARYATPTTVACAPVPGAKDVTLKPMAGRKVILKQQHHVYPVRDDATWARITTQHAALQAALDELAAGLRTFGSYARRLVDAGGMKTAPNPLCATVIQAPDPETDRETWYTSALVPRVERKAIARHTPKMLGVPNDSYVFSQGDCFVCPDDAAWEHIELLRAAAQAQADAWRRLLRHDIPNYMAAKARVGAPGSRPNDGPPPASAFLETSIVLSRTGDVGATDLGEELFGMLQDEGYTWSHADQTPDGRWHHVVRHHTSHGGRYRRERLAGLFCLPAGSPAPLAIAEPPAIAGVVMMSADEARACIARITASLETVRRDLLALHEQEGWKALGYDSWRACVTAEFGQSQSYLYRQLAAAEIERDLGFAIGETPESHLRPLATLPSTEARQQALDRADALAGTQSRQTKHIERAVAEQQAPAAPDPAWKRAATSALLGAAIDRAAGLPPLPDDLAGWRWDIHTNPTGYQLLTPAPGLLWRTSVHPTPALAIAEARAHLAPPAAEPLPVIPALDMDRIAALAVRDIRYISSRTTADGRELHTIRGAFGERETALAGIDHLIAAVSPIEALDAPAAPAWDARATAALDDLMQLDIDPRYPGRLPGTLDLAIELVAALAIGIGLAESELTAKLTAALARYTEAAHAHAA